jgi:hypothetical protein
MQMSRFVRTLVPLVMLGLGGSLLGCSGESVPTQTPPDPEASKKIAEDMKNAAMDRKAARARAASEAVRGGGRR